MSSTKSQAFPGGRPQAIRAEGRQRGVITRTLVQGEVLGVLGLGAGERPGLWLGATRLAALEPGVGPLGAPMRPRARTR